MNLPEIINDDEGVKLQPYLDCCSKHWRDCVCKTKGFLTIGVGTNLDDGITEQEAFQLRDNRLFIAKQECAKYVFFSDLDPVRKDAITSMMFNLGAPRFAEFAKLIAALNRKDFDGAASEMLSSRWASEVGKRAVRLAGMISSGVYPPQ